MILATGSVVQWHTHEGSASPPAAVKYVYVNNDTRSLRSLSHTHMFVPTSRVCCYCITTEVFYQWKMNCCALSMSWKRLHLTWHICLFCFVPCVPTRYCYGYKRHLYISFFIFTLFLTRYQVSFFINILIAYCLSAIIPGVQKVALHK
jgi:hypothetical protein